MPKGASAADRREKYIYARQMGLKPEEAREVRDWGEGRIEWLRRVLLELREIVPDVRRRPTWRELRAWSLRPARFYALLQGWTTAEEEEWEEDEEELGAPWGGSPSTPPLGRIARGRR